KLNTPGMALGALDDVHALTDVTGFGLLGHLLEMCRGARIGAAIEFARIPLHPGVLDLAGQGFVTGASRRNFDAYGNEVALAPEIGGAEPALLSDPQTSGGLLVACAPEAVDSVLAIFRNEGFSEAAQIGHFVAGAPGIDVK
ncbi:MAG TPA: AIR synthase-related protein, partial [Casimicrobiaceae bacterium]|nr:AIR synthase-related protein [Casimicrobiaceae bacterium]